jgi:DNA transformation protein
MAKTNLYLEFVLEWLAPLGAITARSMFGGHCLYCDGTVFALVASHTLYLKVDGETRPAFERLGRRPFRPFEEKMVAQGRPDAAVMQFYPPPAEFFEDRDVMREWGRKAVEAGRRAAARKKRPGVRGGG